jgi:Zn finger protein HypA/HybF involved in hydrogenase expression
MEVLEDGSLLLLAGEKVPFYCHGCKAIFPFVEGETVTCPKCQREGAPEDFDGRFGKVDPS